MPSTIPSSWIARADGRIDAKFWLAVIVAMKELEIDRATANYAEVDRAVAHVKANIAAAQVRARALRDQAQALMLEARTLEKAEVF